MPNMKYTNICVYAVQQDTQSFLMIELIQHIARHVSDLTHTACKQTLMKMDRLGPKRVELTYVLNQLTH